MSSACTIRPFAPADADAVRRLLAANGWASRVESDADFAATLRHAQVKWVAGDAEAACVAGFLGGFSDGVANGFISMLVVAVSHRSRGIGRGLVQAAIGEDERITWVLRSREAVGGFYEAVGFRRSEGAMERKGRY
jgi:GNAT superfamily N-acetyltransferase